MTAAAAPAPVVQAEAPQVVRYEPHGGALALFQCRAPEITMDGPAGTGKSRAALEKVHLALMKHAGAKAFVARKTLLSLKSSTLQTYREKVAAPEIASGFVRYWGARADKPAHYAYANGSELVPLGLDKPGKAMSTEFDMGFTDEATDCIVNDIETLNTRLRNGVMPYQQHILGCNPQGPKHWLAQRMSDGRTHRIVSRHEDNPRYWDRAVQAWTEQGAAYIAILDALTGVRKARLRFGQWVAAEGTIYEEYWDAARNLIERSTISKRPSDLYGDCGIPREWPRYLAIDFGYTHPFVAKWFAEDPDGRLYSYREIYLTKRLVEQHAKTIREVSRWGSADGDPLPRAIVCDHDAEGRATLEAHLGLYTIAADKRVSEGIQAVQSRLLPAGDGKPRYFELKNSLIERDTELADKLLPLCSVDEYDSYVWDTRQHGQRGDVPVKEYDHGMDATRYLCAYKDLQSIPVREIDNPWALDE